MSKKTPATTPGFFKSILASIYSPSFYAGIAERSFWKGFWFLVGFTFLTTVVSGFVVVGVPYLQHRDEINQSIDKVLGFFPENLAITIKDGKASTNVPEPYSVKFNDLVSTESWGQSFRNGFAEGMMKDETVSMDDINILVIDTKTPFSLEQFKKYQTVVWLGQDAIYVLSENDQIEATKFDKTDDVVIDKALADTSMETLWTGIKRVMPLILAGVFVMVFMALVVGRLIYMLLFALFMLIVCSVMNLPYNYAANYKISFYTFTLSSVVSIVFMAFHLDGFIFMSTILSLLVAVVNFDQAKKQGLIKEKKA